MSSVEVAPVRRGRRKAVDVGPIVEGPSVVSSVTPEAKPKRSGVRGFTGEMVEVDGDMVKVRKQPLLSSSNYVGNSKNLNLRLKDGRTKPLIVEGKPLKSLTHGRFKKIKKVGIVLE
jgi:hypothetical protein